MAKERLTEVELAVRAAEIVKMRRAKAHWSEIGERFGITLQRAHQIYQKTLAEHPLTAIQVDEHRIEQLEEIDSQISVLLPIALGTSDPMPSPRTRVEASSAIRAWHAERSKLLGLYAPIEHRLLTMSQLDRDIAELTAFMKSQESGGALDSELAELLSGDPASETDPTPGTHR